MPVCATTGCFRDTGAGWKTHCPKCYARKQHAADLSEDARHAQAQELTEVRAALRIALADNARLLAEVNRRKGAIVTEVWGVAFPKEKMRKLIQLCHPDKHGGSEVANEITSWLLSMKDRGEKQ